MTSQPSSPPWTDEKLPNEPITIWTPYEGWNWVRDTPLSQTVLRKIWNESDEQMFHIANVLNIKVNLDDLIFASANVAYGENALFDHPKLKSTIVVTKDPMITLAIGNMIDAMKRNTGVYVQVPLMLMDSLEKALDYAREQRKSSAT